MRFLAPVKYKLLVAGFGVLALAGVAAGASAYAAGVVPGLPLAAKPSPSPGPAEQACRSFIHHLAQNLGKSDAATQAALQQSADQTIDDAVAAGKLTADQAAKLKQHFNVNSCNFGGRLAPPHGPEMGPAMGLLKAAAEVLNLTPQQLMQDLRSGKTLSQLAGGMTEDQFRQKLIAQEKTDLDAMVKAGKLTQAREDEILQRLQNAPIPFWNSAPKMMPRHPRPDAPDASPPPPPPTGAGA